MIALNLTESQVASIAGASGEIVVRGPDGEVIGYLRTSFREGRNAANAHRRRTLADQEADGGPH